MNDPILLLSIILLAVLIEVVSMAVALSLTERENRKLNADREYLALELARCRVQGGGAEIEKAVAEKIVRRLDEKEHSTQVISFTSVLTHVFPR